MGDKPSSRKPEVRPSGALPAVPLEPLRERDPRELGGFRLLGRLGYGGMGVAYLAEGKGTWAVVKVVRSDLSDSPTFRARLLRELEAMDRTEGPFTASVLSSDLEADPAWFAMEFIPGANLGRAVSDGGTFEDKLANFARELAECLDFVHGKGIIHRDLKPSNVMMSPTGPRLIDFGIAGIEEGTNLTKTGSVVGSTGWLAPEQVTGDPVTAATDVHAWALCVLFAATGIPPFGADTSTAAMYRVLEVTPDIPTWIEKPLRDLLVAAVSKNPSYRPTLDQIISTLTPKAPVMTNPPILVPRTELPASDQVPNSPMAVRRRPRWLVPVGSGTAAAILIALVLGVVMSLNGSSISGETSQSTMSESPSPQDSLESEALESEPSSSSVTPSPSEASPSPTFEVRVEYPGTSIPNKVFTNSLAWDFDVCSPDQALIGAKTLAQVTLYRFEQGKWQKVAAQPSATNGGRCDEDQVNLKIGYQEDPPASVTSSWSACRKYRVVIPETANFQESTIDSCVRTRSV